MKLTLKIACWAGVTAVAGTRVLAVNYEVYPGSAYYLTQMLDRAQWPFVAEYSNGLYHHPVGFQELDDGQEEIYTSHFTNRFSMVEGDMGSGSTTGDVGNLKRMKALGLAPVAAFVNRPSSNLAVWRQLVRNNAAEGAPTYEMLAPHRLDDTALGWNDPVWNYARSNMGVPGCVGSGVDAPIHLFVNEAQAYRQSIYDMRDWTVANGKKFNYLISPNNSYNAALLADTQATVRAMEDNGHEPDVYGVVLYGLRPVDLTPEKVTVNGVDQAATTITGLAYWLLKHRDGEPGTLDLSASRAGTTYAGGQAAPTLASASQVVALSSTASRTYTLRMANTSPWLDYAGVLRARVAGSSQGWTIAFTKGGQDITASVLSDRGRLFVGADRWMPGSQNEVNVTVTPGASPGPLKLVIEALPHEGVDHALDVISLESGTVGNSPPTLALNTMPQVTREALPFGPLWFTGGDAETNSTGLTVTAVSSNTALVPNGNLTLGQSGIQRWIRAVPATGQWGTTQIAVTVSDGVASVTKSFTLEVSRTTVLPIVKANNLLALENGGSWTGSVAPGAVDQAVWDATVTGPQSLTVGADRSFGGLRVVNPGGDITIGGSAVLALGVAGVDCGTATRDLYLNGPTQLDDSGTWSVATGRMIRVAQGISGTGGLAKSGSGKLELLGNDSFAGPLSVSAGECVKTGSGTQSSTTVSTNGILKISHSGGFGAGGASVTAANSSTGRIEISGGVSVLAGKTLTMNARTSNSDAIVSRGENTLAANVSLSTGGSVYAFNSAEGLLTLSGNVSAITAGDRTITLRGNADGRMTGAISNGSGTAVGVIKSGAGKWTLAGNHSFTGAVTHQAGALEVATALPVQPLAVSNGAVLTGSGALGGSVTIAGTHSAGAGIGSQTVEGPLVYQSSGRMRVELAGQTAVADLVQAAAVTIHAGAKVEVVSNAAGGAVSFQQPFWRQPQSWTVLTATSLTGEFALDSEVVPVDLPGKPAAPFGAFSLVHGANSVSLQWTPAPPFQVWQYENFADLWNNEAIAGADRDPDGDGWTNRSEWIAGTIPTAAASKFTATLAAGNLSFGRLADRIYRVETSTDLAAGWSLHAMVPAGVGAVSVPCPGSSPGAARFYRVSISWFP